MGTYLWTLGAEIIGALSTKVYDPVAWLALIGGLALGAFSNPRRPWWGALGWGVLAGVVLTLESAYLGAPMPRGNSPALAIVCLMGVVAGGQLRSRFSRRSAQHS
jgi:hypothetical protein